MPVGKRQIDELASGKLGALLVKYSWPALVAMTLNTLYAVVDRFWIGHGCGEAAIAGLTLVFPVVMAFAAFGVFVGAGHSAVLSIKLGEGDRVTCEKLLGELVAIKLIFFFILPPLVFFNADTVLDWCGGSKVSPETLACACTYLRLVVFSHFFSHLAFGLSALMRAEGAAVSSMSCMIVGFGTNLVLDPLFIFSYDVFGVKVGLGMGIAGAAWATNIAMFASCAYALSRYLFRKTVVRLRLGRIRLYWNLVARTSAIGFAPFFQHFLGAAINLSLQLAFAKWAPDEASATKQVASLGVFQAALMLTLTPVIGAQLGLQPIIGYNWGARNYRRVRDALVMGLCLTTAFCFLSFVVQVVPPFSTWVARIFVDSGNPDLIAIAAHDLALSNCMIWTIGLNIVATTYFQAIGHPKMAIILSTMRQGFIMLPVIWFLPHVMDNKTLAIWLSMPVSDVLCCLATLPPFLFNVRFLSKVRERRKTTAARAFDDISTKEERKD